MALHGIQLFIGAAVLGRLVGLDLRRQLTAVRMTVGGYLSLVAWSMVHTSAGRAPLDLGGTEAILGLAGLALLASAAVMIAGGLRGASAENLAREAAVTLTS